VDTLTATLLRIARCSNLTAHRDGGPCSQVLATQGTWDPDRFHVPEPWRGDIGAAPLLFISSNPSWDPDDDPPVAALGDDAIVEYTRRAASRRSFREIYGGAASRTGARSPSGRRSARERRSSMSDLVSRSSLGKTSPDGDRALQVSRRGRSLGCSVGMFFAPLCFGSAPFCGPRRCGSRRGRSARPESRDR
jgi:hypothetical protein